MTRLLVLMNGVEAGRLDYERGRLSFSYTPEWRERDDAVPISLSMPLSAGVHTGAVVSAYIWGLLPDNFQIIQEWSRRFQVSASQPFGLIGAVGEDCAGAIQFIRPERAEAIASGEHDGVDWLSSDDIAERLAGLRTNQGAWRRTGDKGQFSLAGAQPKIALIRQNDRWGIPYGRMPTTHILKPPSAGFDAHAENEHFCLSVLRGLGVPANHTRVQWFGSELAIVIERYDRLTTEGGIVRIHQEDVCQALGVSPDRKYQNDRGPGLKETIALLRAASSAPQEDTDTLIAATIFNWIIGGSDAHAKNFSLLLAAPMRARLAPIYDVASVLPYAPQIQIQDVRLAMRIGGEYRLNEIGLRHWRRFADENRIDFDDLRERILDIATRLPDLAAATRDQIANAGAPHTLNDRLAATFTERSRWVLAQPG